MRENNSKRRPGFHFKATGIGSVPSKDVRGSCLHILKHLPDIPFWPQLVRRSHLEDMSVQFSEGLPLLEVSEEKRALVVSSGETESELVKFYERFLAEDVDYFAISEDYAPGLEGLLKSLRESPEHGGPLIKGQTVGPVTFAAGIVDPSGKPVLHNPDLLDAMVKGLAIKALWQIRKLSESGKKPIIFLDEPYLSGFGSAFTPIQRHEVINLIGDMINFLRERSDALIGIHCCGNTDWSMIVEVDPDIISFDAFGYMDYFFLYPEEIARFMRKGGSIAWGIVPTADFNGKESVDGLASKLEAGLTRLHDLGVDSDTAAGGSILSPACGMGSMTQASADKALDLLQRLSERFT